MRILILLVIFCIILVVPFIIADIPPEIPIMIYGKVVYTNNLPAGGISVRAIWTDNNGDINSRVTKAFNIEEAKDNPELYGVYKFEIYNVQEDIPIKIESGGKSILLTPEYGKIYQAPVIKINIPEGENQEVYNATMKNDNILFGVINYIAGLIGIKEGKNINEKATQERNNNENYTKKNISDEIESNEQDRDSSDQEITIKEHEVDKNINNKSRLTYNKEKIINNESEGIVYFIINNTKEKINYYLIIIILILITIIIILLKMYFPKKIFKTSIKNFKSVESFHLISKDNYYLSPDNSVMDAIEIFSYKNINLIPVLTASKKILGVLSKNDIIKTFENSDYDLINKTKIKSIMNKRYISCKPKTELGDMFTLMIEKKINEIILEKDKTFVGIVDFFSILNKLNNTNVVIENPPKLNEVMLKEVTSVEVKTKISDLRKILLKKNSEYAVITKDSVSIGIITYKDILIAIKKNIDFKKTNVETIMSPDLITLTPGTSIYEAFKIMLERKYNQIPILEFDKLEGIVNIKYLVKMYYEFLSNLKNKIKNRPFSEIELIDENN